MYGSTAAPAKTRRLMPSEIGERKTGERSFKKKGEKKGKKLTLSRKLFKEESWKDSCTNPRMKSDF